MLLFKHFHVLESERRGAIGMGDSTVRHTIVLASDRSAPRGMCNVLSHKPLQKSIAKGCGQSQWRGKAQTGWADSHNGWVPAYGDDEGRAPLARVRGTCIVISYFLLSARTAGTIGTGKASFDTVQ